MKTLPPPDLNNPWIWLQQVFPVRTFHSLARVPDLPENVPDSTGTYYEPFAWWDANHSCWRTWQGCLLEGWTRYREAWPRSGMTRNGIAYRRVPLVPHTEGIGSGLLPTPTRSDFGGSGDKRAETRKRSYLKDYLHYYDAGRGNGASYPHPEFVEALMGFPIGHTELKH